MHFWHIRKKDGHLLDNGRRRSPLTIGEDMRWLLLWHALGSHRHAVQPRHCEIMTILGEPNGSKNGEWFLETALHR